MTEIKAFSQRGRPLCYGDKHSLRDKKTWILSDESSAGQVKAPTQVQKDFQRIIRGIGTPAKPPKSRNKSRGRARGETQPKRLCHPVVFKAKKREVIALNTT